MAGSERQVGRYKVIRQIGRGGMAIVYLARQETLDREVALKELSSFHASAPEMAQRFLRESRLAGSLNHPNIVTVLEYFEDGGVPYIAMEYVRRGSLRPYVGRLSTAQFVGVMEGVLAGLAHAETQNIVHRDLKPENIMVTADGRVKITDFGIAKATQSAGTGVFLTAAGTTVGTPTYMAPEQAMGQDIGIWTDLYSVGVMAWEHVVGHVPFHDSDVPMVILTRQLNEVIPPAASINPDVDPELSDWIDRLLVKNPHERAQSPVTVWDELEEIIIAKLGPRWRREARLPSPSQVFDTPHPLTPAPFESQKVVTPAPLTPPERPVTSTPPQPVSPPAGEKSVTAAAAVAGAEAAAAAVEAAAAGVEEAAPKPDTGYVTFGPASGAAEPVTPPVREAAGPAEAHEAAQRTAEPAGSPPTPQASAIPEAPAGPPETPAEPPDTTSAGLEEPVVDAEPERPHETYVTYGRGPAAPPRPEPAVPEEPAEPAPTAEPVAPAQPVLDDRTLPGQLAAVPPVAEPEVAEPAPAPPEPEPARSEPEPAPPEPEPAPLEPEPRLEPEPVPAPEPEPEPVGAPARPNFAARRRAVVAAVVGIAAAAVIGFLVSPKSGGGSNTTQAQLPNSASNGPISVSFPAGWQRQSPTLPTDLRFNNRIVLTPDAPAGGMLVLGSATTTDPSLLPKALLTALPGGAPSHQVVTLGRSQFYRYLALTPSGVNGPVSVYALPTTSAGTVLAACVLHGAAPKFASDCESVLSSLQLSGTSPAGLGPSSTLATELSDIVGKLNTAVADGQARLKHAGKPAQQSAAAAQLASAYAQAAAALNKLNPGPAAAAAVTALAGALTKTGHDYTALSRAAAHNNGHAYTAATNAIGTDSGSISDAFSQLAKLGYAS
jgi:serine/threonine protein kinase